MEWYEMMRLGCKRMVLTQLIGVRDIRKIMVDCKRLQWKFDKKDISKDFATLLHEIAVYNPYQDITWESYIEDDEPLYPDNQ